MDDKKKEYADLIISGIVPTKAITVVFPGISPKTARNKSSLFGKDPEIEVYIRDALGHIKEKISTISEQIIDTEIKKGVDKKAGSVLTAIRKHQILNEIAEGKAMFEKVIIIDGKVRRIKCKPTPQERLKAIEIANRMSGDHVLAKPNIVAKAEEVEKIVVVEDNTDNDGINDNY